MEPLNHKDYIYYPMSVIEKVNSIRSSKKQDTKKLVEYNQLLVKNNNKLRKENEQLKSKIRVMEGYLKFIEGKDNE